jgi:hypothetical protein
MGTVSRGHTRGGGWSSGVLGECRPRARVTCLYTFLRTDLAICPRRVSRCFPPSPAPSKYDEEGNSMLNRLYGAGRSDALYPSPTVEISLFSSPLGHHSDARGKMGKQRDQTSSSNIGKGLSVFLSRIFLPQAFLSSGVAAARMRYPSSTSSRITLSRSVLLPPRASRIVSLF